MSATNSGSVSEGFSAEERAAMKERALAERVHITITSTAPQLSPKTWYGMPSYANADRKAVIFFQESGKFKAP